MSALGSDEEEHGRRRGEPEGGHLELALPESSDQQDAEDGAGDERRQQQGVARRG